MSTTAFTPAFPSAKDSAWAESLWLPWTASVLFVAAAAASVVLCEWRVYYFQATILHSMQLDPWDTLLVAWSLWAKSWWLLLPALLLGAAFGCFRLRRAMIVAVLGASLLALAWLIADLRIQRITGCHLSRYLAEAGQITNWQLVGDVSSLQWKLAKDLGQCVAGALATLTACCLGLGWLARRWRWVGSRRLAVALTAVLLLLGWAIIPARQYVHKPLALAMLYDAIPSSFAPFSSECLPDATDPVSTILSAHHAPGGSAPRYEELMRGQPVDGEARFDGRGAPNVLLLIVESFRDDVLCAQRMPRLASWGRRGLRFARHYANGNNSVLGAFALLYGRSPLALDQTLETAQAPQMCVTFGRSGYERSLVASIDFEFAGMNRYMNERFFDRMVLHVDGKWPHRDRQTLERIGRILAAAQGKPQLVVAYLQSTHFPYEYPAEYEKLLPAPRDMSDRKAVWNRYRNAAAFMDDELGRFVSALDPSRNIVAVTGDHGEALYDDGFLAHGSRLSEGQTRVPLLIVGGGLPARTVEHLSSHVDVLCTLLHAAAGRPVAIAHCHGRDLLSETSEPGQVLLAHESFGGWQLLLVRPDGRLSLNVRRSQQDVKVLGFYDEYGRVDPSVERPVEDLPAWRQAMCSELQRMTR